MNKPLIAAKELSFSYENDQRRIKVLRQINLQINRGEFVVIVGRNGSGKSTLAKHFNSILTPSSGTVLVDGIDTAVPKTAFEVRRRVGMVFQNPDNQLVATMVEEDVAFALENLGVPPMEIRRRVDKALRVVGMYDYRRHSPSQLSGGQKQRVAIAGVLAMQPKCIVLDEATAMLDPEGREEVMKTIHQLNDEKAVTIVHITHFMEEAALADRVVVLQDGKIQQDGTPKEVFSQVDLLHRAGLELPQITQLTYDIADHEIVFTLEECVSALKRRLGESL